MTIARACLSVICVLCVGILCWGCASGQSDSALPGVTTLQVTVRAESKSGWKDPSRESWYTESLRPGEDKAFQTIDYKAIEDVVVWVEPEVSPASIGMAATAGNISINLGQTRPELRVAGRGSIWDFRNATGRVEEVYLRNEAGQVISLGRIAGPGRSMLPEVEGLVEVMIASKPDPVARVFVAPSAFVRLATSGGPVTLVALPPGRAKVVAWHERLPGSSTQVNLEPGKATKATVTIGVNSLPKVP